MNAEKLKFLSRWNSGGAINRRLFCMLLCQEPWRWDRNRTERWENRHYQSPESPDARCKAECASYIRGVYLPSPQQRPHDPSHPHPHPLELPLVSCRGCESSWLLCTSQRTCELIQCGRTVKAWLEPRGEWGARKERENGGRKRERERDRGEVNEWKILHGGENEGGTS